LDPSKSPRRAGADLHVHSKTGERDVALVLRDVVQGPASE